MDKIDFWKDKERKTVDPTLYSYKAAALSEELAGECKQSRGHKLNKRTQIRKFYDEVVRLDMAARTRAQDWEKILPLVHMVIAKAAYANGRKLVSDNFVKFIRSSIEQVKDPQDLNIFANFFEAFVGFYRMDCPAD